MVSAWDQNAAFQVQSPVAAELEATALGWVSKLLGLPAGNGGAVVTGATMANFCALAAARHALLERAGSFGILDLEELTTLTGMTSDRRPQRSSPSSRPTPNFTRSTVGWKGFRRARCDPCTGAANHAVAHHSSYAIRWRPAAARLGRVPRRIPLIWMPHTMLPFGGR